MSEEQKGYNPCSGCEECKPECDKKITYTKLAYFVGGLGLQKIIENNDKDNLLGRSFVNLVKRAGEERMERLDAGAEWFYNRSDENKMAFLFEIADEINFLMAMAGKVAGYKVLIRE